MSTKSTTNSNADKLGVELRQRFGDRLQENCSLEPYFCSRVGGVVEYLLEIEDIDELVAACQIAVAAGRPLAVVGGGTGTIASHVGALGLVVVNRAGKIFFAEDNSLVVVESGAINQTLIMQAASRGLGGLEFLIAIPGSVGGAIVTDARYGTVSLHRFIKKISLWHSDGRESSVVSVSLPEALFLMKQSGAYKPIILTVHLQFSRLYREEIMRRLRDHHQRAKQIADPRSVVGSPFSPFIEETAGQFSFLERVRRPHLKLSAREGIITASNKVQPQQLREYLAALRATATASGHTLADRVTYLGYWPDEGDDEQK